MLTIILKLLTLTLLSVFLLVDSTCASSSYSKYVQYTFETLAGNTLTNTALSFRLVSHSKLNPEILYIVANSDSLYKYNQTSGSRQLIVGCVLQRVDDLCLREFMELNTPYPATHIQIYITGFDMDSSEQIIYIASDHQLFRLEGQNITLLSKKWTVDSIDFIDGMHVSNYRFNILRGITLDESRKQLYLTEGSFIIKLDLESGILNAITAKGEDIIEKNPIYKFDGYANQTFLNVPYRLLYHKGFIYGQDSFSMFKINTETGWLTVITGTVNSPFVNISTPTPKSGDIAKNSTLLTIRGLHIMEDDSILVISYSNLFQIDQKTGLINFLYSFKDPVFLASYNCVFSTQKIYKLNRENWSMIPVIDSEIGALIDGSNAKNRKFFSISALTMNETTGDLLFSDSMSNYNLYRVDKEGNFYNVKLQSSNVSCWDSSVRTSSSLAFNPVSLQLRNSNLYVANSGMHSSIQKFDLSQGGSSCFYSGTISTDRLLQQGDGLSMLVNNPTGLYCSPSSNEIFIADTDSSRILKRSTMGNFIVIAGTGVAGYNGDGILAIHAQLNRPHSVFYDDHYRILYIADSANHRIRAISADGIISTIIGTGVGGFNGDGLGPLATQINFPKAVVQTNFIGIVFSDSYNHRIRSLNGNITTILGTGTSGMKIVEDNPIMTEIISPFGLFWSPAKASLYVADQFNHRILQLRQNVVSVIAGTNLHGYNGDGMKPTLAKLFLPSSVIVTTSDEVLIADTYNNMIRKITKGIISSVSPRTEVAQSYQIKQPIGLCELLFSTIFVTTENTVTSLNTYSTTRTMVGGNGDGMNVYYADVNPTRMIVAPFGKEESIIFSEANSNRIRYVNAEGIVSTIVGSGIFGFMGDKYPAAYAFLASPTGIALDPISKDLLLCDTSNNRVRIAKITENRMIDTIAGTGNSGSGTVDTVSDPLLSPLNNPRLVSVFSNQDIVIADTLNNMIKVLSKREGKIRFIGYALATDMYVTKDNIIYFSTNEEINKMVPYCETGYQLVENNTDCIPICFGLTGNLTCNRNGDCISPNTCKCSPEFTGVQCDIPICYGIPSTNSGVCNYGNGTCPSPNKCNCNEGFYGDQCQYPICFSALIETSCSGINRGVCVHSNKCSCKEHFTGKECEYRSCYGKSEVDENVCNGKGRCGSAGKCECNLGYAGPDCSDLTQIYAISITSAVILLILIVLMIISSILGWVLYKRNKRDRKIIETELSLDERLLSNADVELSNTSADSQTTTSTEDASSFVIPLHKLGMDKPIRRLGEGGMGQVFQTKYNGMIVAVKVFDLNNLNISEEDFRNEAILLSKVRHPNIITFYGVSSSPTKRFIVMECLDQSLEKFIALVETKLIQLSFHQKLKMLLNIANGIEYLHTMQPRKIIHRDLKPQNILLDSNGNCKVCDFGLSKSISQGTISTLTNRLGTFYYMSPEMFDLEAVDPTFATAIDIYSFSIIGWQLLFESKDPYIYNNPQVARKLSSKVLDQVTSYQLTKLICENNYRPSIPFNSIESCKEWCSEFLPSNDQANFSAIFNLCQLITQCWQGNPKLRPSIEQIVEKLQSLEQELN